MHKINAVKFSLRPNCFVLDCFSMQVVMNKCFLLNPEKKFGADPSCRFQEKRTFNSGKWRHRAGS